MNKRLCAVTIVLLGAGGAARADGLSAPGSGVIGLEVRTWESTGRATFVAAAAGAGQTSLPAAGTAQSFLESHGRLFGVTDVSAELVALPAQRDALGHTHVTYRQVHRGVPVFASMIKVHHDAAGRFVAANGDFHPLNAKLGTTPSLTSTQAAEQAARATGFSELCAVSTELLVVDPGWYGDPPQGAHLAYQVILRDEATSREEAVFVDAHSGDVLDRWTLTCTALERAVHDAAGTADLPGPLARGEGDPPSTDADVNIVYDYAGDTYQYFWHAFGRDGLDGAGQTMVATVNSAAYSCPNAWWSFTFQQAGFCTGVVSDDVVAHEMTHGITQNTANLIYQNQSGQLNESFSDVFGELVDLFNGGAAFVGTVGLPPTWSSHPSGPGDDADNRPRSACTADPTFYDGVRWLFAEGVVPWNGAIRDMWDPPCMGDPDRANSPLQTCNLLDSGGVHSGSGIPNHAFALLCDGGTFNGHTISPIGPIKAGAVWYRALTVYLTVAADFEDACAAFNQAAADLVGTHPADPRTGLPITDPFTSADAAAVDQALLAVEMNTAGACGATVPILSTEPPVQCTDPEIVFADDGESGSGSWTVFNTNPPHPYDWALSTEALPAYRPGHAWFCADPNLGDCATTETDESGIHSLVSPPIALPADLHLPALTFTHYLEIEPRWDGGHVLIRVNGGTWQPLPAAAFRFNGYNTQLFTAAQLNTNPYSGQLTFSGADTHWGTSVVDLSTFVQGGDVLEVRFDFSKDKCSGITGWFVDDVTVYHCPASSDCNSNAVADELDVAAGLHRDALVVQPPNHSSGNPSDLDNGGLGVTAIADNFVLLRPLRIEQIRLWGGYYRDSLAPPDDFTVIFLESAGSLPGATVATRSHVPSMRSATGRTFMSTSIDEWEYTLTLDEPVELAAGTWFVEILNNTVGSTDTFIWQRATTGHILGGAGSYQAPGVTWILDPHINFSLEIYGPLTGADCNANVRPDECDAAGDHDGDGVVGLSDLAALVECLSGPGVVVTPACACLLDADGDTDLDLRDYALFLEYASEP